MKNPIHRNRNIGTKTQGHGANNKLVIPYSCVVCKVYYEILGKYSIVERTIDSRNFKIVVEATRENSVHACSVGDVEAILRLIPIKDLGDLNLIIFKQTTRKEELLQGAWGRLVYSYEFEKDYVPAIILNSIVLEHSLKFSKRMSIDDQAEFRRLKEDGHQFVDEKRYFIAPIEIESSRTTQLYRTLLHEIGHYKQYYDMVLKPLENLKVKVDELSAQLDGSDTTETNPIFDKWDQLSDEYDAKEEENEKIYFSIPQNEREIFANRYADNLSKALENKGLIPFERI
jgi:hypothetical protein